MCVCATSVHLLHGLVGCGDLALIGLAGAVLALENALAVVRQLQLCDLDVGCVDANGDSRAVGLLPLDLVDVDDPLEAVAGGDLALAALEPAALHADLVVLANGQRAHVVLGAELLAERGAHKDAADVAGGLEMSPAGLSAAAALDADHRYLRLPHYRWNGEKMMNWSIQRKEKRVAATGGQFRQTTRRAGGE